MPITGGVGSFSSGDKPERRLARDQAIQFPKTELQIEKASLSEISGELAKARVLDAVRQSMIDANAAADVSFSLSFGLSF